MIQKMDTKLIKRLREVTGLGLKECFDLLKKSDGDLDSAIKNAEGVIGKISDKINKRQSSSGKIFSYIHFDKKSGCLLHLCSETDFVSNTEEFEQLANDITLHVTANNPKDIAGLLKQPFVKDPSQSIQDLISSLQIKVGEKIEIKNFAVFN